MLKLTIAGKTELLDEARSDEALKKYWEAKTGGDATAALVRVEEEGEDTPDPTPLADEDPPEEPITLPPLSETSAGQISDLATERIARQEQWLSEAGFSIPPPLFTPGTRVVDVGDENFRLERTRIKELPYFDDVSKEVITLIGNEEREDREVSLKDLTLTTTGSLIVEPLGNEYALGASAFHQLATLAGFGAGARYLRDQCSPELRSANVNYQLTHGHNRRVVLRTRKGVGNRRHVFGVVTSSYTSLDTDIVLGAVRPALAEAHAELRYDGDGVYATAIWTADEVIDLAAGDVFKAGVRITTNDLGKGRITIAAVVWRNLCLNLIIIGEGQVSTLSRVHRGDPEAMVAHIHEGVDEARAKVADFLTAWGHARSLRVDPPKLIKKWVDGKRIKVKGENDKERLVNIFLTAWAKEPGNSLADVVNAITRAAHEHTEWSQTIREELERQAAELIYVKV